MKIRVIFAEFVVCPKSLATCSSSRWFKVTFWFPSWRWFTPSKGHFTIPKKSQLIARILKLSVVGKETSPFSKWLLTHPLISFVYPSEHFPTMLAKLLFVKKPLENFLWLPQKNTSWFQFQSIFNQSTVFISCPIVFGKKTATTTPLHQQVWAFGSNRSMELGGLTEPRSVRNGVTCYGKIPGLIKCHLFWGNQSMQIDGNFQGFLKNNSAWSLGW